MPSLMTDLRAGRLETTVHLMGQPPAPDNPFPPTTGPPLYSPVWDSPAYPVLNTRVHWASTVTRAL